MVEGDSEGDSVAGAMEGGVGEVREVSGEAAPVSMAPAAAVAAAVGGVAADTEGVGGHHRSSGDDSAGDKTATLRVDGARIGLTLLKMWREVENGEHASSSNVLTSMASTPSFV